MNYNKLMIGGRVTRDIELRYTPSGTAVADIGLAVNRTRKGDNGEKIEETTFVDVTAWGRTAEIAQKYSGKGKPLFIEGRLQMDEWTDKESGKQRSKLKVVADNIQLLNGRDDNQGQPQQQSPSQQPAGVQENEDIPF